MGLSLQAGALEDKGPSRRRSGFREWFSNLDPVVQSVGELKVIFRLV
jgi:hypothetical protein